MKFKWSKLQKDSWLVPVGTMVLDTIWTNFNKIQLISMISMQAWWRIKLELQILTFDYVKTGRLNDLSTDSPDELPYGSQIRCYYRIPYVKAMPLPLPLADLQSEVSIAGSTLLHESQRKSNSEVEGTALHDFWNDNMNFEEDNGACEQKS
jgi:hypothetical protein